MAQHLGITRSYLSQLENFRRDVTSEIDAKVRAALDEFEAGTRPDDYRGAPRDPIRGNELLKLADQPPEMIWPEIDRCLGEMDEDGLRIALAFFRAADPRRKRPVVELCDIVSRRLLWDLRVRESRGEHKVDS